MTLILLLKVSEREGFSQLGRSLFSLSENVDFFSEIQVRIKGGTITSTREYGIRLKDDFKNFVWKKTACGKVKFSCREILVTFDLTKLICQSMNLAGLGLGRPGS